MSAHKQLPHHSPDWHGYTLDELRYMRAYTAARIEINREHIVNRVRQLSKTGKNGMTSTGLVGRMLSAFSYIDIAIIAWKVGARALKMVRAIRR